MGLFYEQIGGLWQAGRASMVTGMSEQDGRVHLTVWNPPLHKEGRELVFRDVQVLTEPPDKDTPPEMTGCQRYGAFVPEEQYPPLDIGGTGYA